MTSIGGLNSIGNTFSRFLAFELEVLGTVLSIFTYFASLFLNLTAIFVFSISNFIICFLGNLFLKFFIQIQYSLYFAKMVACSSAPLYTSNKSSAEPFLVLRQW